MATKIRPARVEEADMLTDLVLRSKAYWGYDQDFMEAAVPVLAITPEFLRDNHSFVLEVDGKRVGLSSLVHQGETVILDNLFIAPEYIGQGYGQLLWDHALEYAKKNGYKAIELDSEPFAVGFYEKQGAVIVGESNSTIREGRVLPVMRLELE
jgi:GNAT superfamily N-acetyltransferase